MPSKIRLKRISDRLHAELAEMLVKEAQDPRLVGITVTDVKVDRELAYADVYVSAVEGHERSKEVLEGLERARGFLRSQLAARVDLRVIPQLRFHWDPTPERADHLEQVFAEMRSEEERRAAEMPTEPVTGEEDEDDDV